ncbi:hypothetical protein BGW80DRAFT_152208 [Lactifluus volemus]|nr:hypothetical protein BGW80DRAFT_152208 [Lactifluus volemus]
MAYRQKGYQGESVRKHGHCGATRTTHQKHKPPSTPDIPRPRKGMESWGLQGGSTASSDAGGETRRGDIRSHRNTCAELEAARLGVELQRRRDARRIRHEQTAKRLRMESWALKQRAELLERKADEVDRLVERKMKGGTFDDDSESELSESESTVMVCGDDEKERASQQSYTYARTEVYSGSEQQTWVLVFQQQGVALQVSIAHAHGT